MGHLKDCNPQNELLGHIGRLECVAVSFEFSKKNWKPPFFNLRSIVRFTIKLRKNDESLSLIARQLDRRGSPSRAHVIFQVYERYFEFLINPLSIRLRGSAMRDGYSLQNHYRCENIETGGEFKYAPKD